MLASSTHSVAEVGYQEGGGVNNVGDRLPVAARRTVGLSRAWSTWV
jgi:hypothetical protein